MVNNVQSAASFNSNQNCRLVAFESICRRQNLCLTSEIC